jgi:hypothetical protein
MFDIAEDEPWTPELLEDVIANYGSTEPFPDGRTYEITPIHDLPDAEELIARRIEVDRENLYGLDPSRYLGMVHHDAVPLNGDLSDLTARFHIKKVGDDRLTLEFLDIHVM